MEKHYTLYLNYWSRLSENVVDGIDRYPHHGGETDKKSKNFCPFRIIVFSSVLHWRVGETVEDKNGLEKYYYFLDFSSTKTIYLVDFWVVTARGSDSGLSLGVPTKIKACKSVLYTEVFLKVEIKNTCLILLSHFILSHFGQMLYAGWHIYIRWLESCLSELWRFSRHR